GEKAFLQGLLDRDAKIRQNAFTLLKNYGSTASIPALKSAALGKTDDAGVTFGAWDAWKTIASYVPKPAKSTTTDQPKPGPVAQKKPPVQVGDATVTTLDEMANLTVAVAMAADGQGYYTLARDGTVRRLGWDGKQHARAAGGNGATILAVSAEG